MLCLCLAIRYVLFLESETDKRFTYGSTYLSLSLSLLIPSLETTSGGDKARAGLGSITLLRLYSEHTDNMCECVEHGKVVVVVVKERR